MDAAKEKDTATLLVKKFPVDLRLRVKAVATLEKRPMVMVLADAIEHGLAVMEKKGGATARMK